MTGPWDSILSNPEKKISIFKPVHVSWPSKQLQIKTMISNHLGKPLFFLLSLHNSLRGYCVCRGSHRSLCNDEKQKHLNELL